MGVPGCLSTGDRLVQNGFFGPVSLKLPATRAVVVALVAFVPSRLRL